MSKTKTKTKTTTPRTTPARAKAITKAPARAVTLAAALTKAGAPFASEPLPSNVSIRDADGNVVEDLGRSPGTARGLAALTQDDGLLHGVISGLRYSLPRIDDARITYYWNKIRKFDPSLPTHARLAAALSKAGDNSDEQRRLLAALDAALLKSIDHSWTHDYVVQYLAWVDLPWIGPAATRVLEARGLPVPKPWTKGTK